MPEPIKLRLADIPEDLKDSSTKGQLAAAVREGIRRQEKRQAEANAKREGEHAGLVQGIKAAHIEELNRSGKIVSRAAHRDGLLQGIVMGMALAIALAFSTWIILREVVITNVATQRVPRASVPVLQDSYQGDPAYERNSREPPSAH